MSIRHYHTLCNKYRGRPVAIRCHDGHVHRGIIQHVDPDRVYLKPIGRHPRNLGGFGYGFGPGFGWGGYGAGWGVALGSIVALSLLPLFFW